jgi:hypothetical protein
VAGEVPVLPTPTRRRAVVPTVRPAPTYEQAWHAAPVGALADRFWAKVDKESHAPCWLWAGMQRKGYGYLSVRHGPRKLGRTKRELAHRLSYRMHHGVIPRGLIVRHLCGFSLCVNPAHLAIGTHLDNMRDAKKHRKNRLTISDT